MLTGVAVLGVYRTLTITAPVAPPSFREPAIPHPPLPARPVTPEPQHSGTTLRFEHREVLTPVVTTPSAGERKLPVEMTEAEQMPGAPDQPAFGADNTAGVEAYQAGQYEAALEHFQRALAGSPDHPILRHNMAAAAAATGWASVEKGETDEAIHNFRLAIDYDRTEASFYAGLGAAYQLQNDLQRAVDALRAAVALEPTRAELYEQLGDLLYQRNQLTEAMDVLTMGIERVAEPDRLSTMLARLTREQAVQANFQETGTRHFLIQFEGGENRDAAYQVLDLLELAYRDVGQALSYFPAREITAILYSQEQFRDITHTPDWTKGVYDGKIRLPVGGAEHDRPLLAKVLYHEYTHVIVHELTGNRVPTWLNEGLAVYCEGLATGNLDGHRDGARETTEPLPDGQLIPLASLHGSFLGFSETQASLAYRESYDATRFLIDRYGLYRVKDLFQSLGANVPFERAFQDAFFISYAEFERLWHSTINS